MMIKALIPSRLAALVAACLFAFSVVVQAETWKMATKMPPDSPEGIIFQKFADLVGEYTDGELTVKVFPSEQLGGAEAVLEQVSAGTVHIYAEDADYLAKWEPDMSWGSASFMFDDRDHWLRFQKSDLAKGWRDKARVESGITTIGDIGPILRGPYRVLAVKNPVESFEDFQGTKLRMYDDDLAVKIWNWLGADVRVLDWTDVYQSIKTGIVEGVTTPVSLVESMKFHEVAPHIVRIDEYPQANGFLVNEAAYDALSPEVREGVLRAYEETGEYSFEVLIGVTDESLERMQAGGATYSEIDTSGFVERMKEFYQMMDAEGALPEGFLATVEATR